MLRFVHAECARHQPPTACRVTKIRLPANSHPAPPPIDILNEGLHLLESLLDAGSHLGGRGLRAGFVAGADDGDVVVVDEVAEAVPLRDDRAESEHAQIRLRAVGRRQVPRLGVLERRVLEQVHLGALLGGDGGHGGEVAVDARAVRAPLGVAAVRLRRCLHQRQRLRLGGVLSEGLDEGLAVRGGGANGLRAAVMELARRTRLVDGGHPPVQLVVRRLERQLDRAVRAAVPPLDGALPELGEVDDGGLQVARQLGVVRLRRRDLALHVRGHREDQGLGRGGGGGGVGGEGREGAGGVGLAEGVVHGLTDEAAPVGAVRVGVLAGDAHEAGLVHNQHELVPPASSGGGDQEAVGSLHQVIRVLRRTVQAHHDNRLVDLLEQGLVGRVLLQGGARIGPHIAILGSQTLNLGTLGARRGHLLNFVELRLQSSDIENRAVL
mmetsp:Transcript_17319/g.37675  ORF Transcript_17319/g.37675 Transcript_17319/m.37675 type:complete len:438 (+) Transcript_17319:129-1442(+)